MGLIWATWRVEIGKNISSGITWHKSCPLVAWPIHLLTALLATDARISKQYTDEAINCCRVTCLPISFKAILQYEAITWLHFTDGSTEVDNGNNWLCHHQSVMAAFQVAETHCTVAKNSNFGSTFTSNAHVCCTKLGRHPHTTCCSRMSPYHRWIWRGWTACSAQCSQHCSCTHVEVPATRTARVRVRYVEWD